MYTKRVDVLKVLEEAGGERIGDGKDRKGTGKNWAE
jgi:hypothetical protein